MALVKRAMVLFCLFLVLFMAVLEVSFAAIYKVGDSAGWTIIGNVDYRKWASTNNFHVGDIIRFEYNNQFHNVMHVKHENFQACNASAPIATYRSGNDSITVNQTGHYYYLCGVLGHCQAGQKVDIRVPRASSAMAPTPSPSPSGGVTAPAPSVNSASSHTLEGLRGNIGLLALTLLVACLSVSLH